MFKLCMCVVLLACGAVATSSVLDTVAPDSNALSPRAELQQTCANQISCSSCTSQSGCGWYVPVVVVGAVLVPVPVAEEKEEGGRGEAAEQ